MTRRRDRRTGDLTLVPSPPTYAKHLACGTMVEWRRVACDVAESELNVWCPTCQRPVAPAELDMPGPMVAWKAGTE